MKIFEVNCDAERYQYLLWDTRGKKTFQFPDFDGARVEGNSWPPAEVYSLYPKRRTPDIWGLDIASGAIAMGTKAFDTLECFVEMAGEALPLGYVSEQLMVVNILECLNCLDEEKSLWRKYPPHIKQKVLEMPCIRSDRLTTSTLFKSAHNPRRIFCWEEEADPEYEFKACVEANKLTGLLFKEVLVSQ